MSRKIVWSYGGGKQSAAIAALIVRGKLPKPDAIVISDTERERSATWRYLDAVIAPALREIGLEVVRIPKSQFATVDLFSAKGDVLIPAFTTQTNSGLTAKLPTYCSNEWKRRVVIRWMAANGYKPAEMWLGISTDEAHRMKDSDTKWLTHRYPLIDLLMSREDCKRIVAEMGCRKPRKAPVRCVRIFQIQRGWKCSEKTRRTSPILWRLSARFNSETLIFSCIAAGNRLAR